MSERVTTSPFGDPATELSAECVCFSVTPQTKDADGSDLTDPVNWIIDSTGKLVTP